MSGWAFLSVAVVCATVCAVVFMACVTWNPRRARKAFVCPRGHRHYEASAFCTVCGAGPVEGPAAGDGQP